MAVTNLTGYTWVANESIETNGPEKPLSINFTSNSINYTLFSMTPSDLKYNSTNVYDSFGSGWLNSNYKTVLFTGGNDVTNTNLISWLEENGTLTAGYEVTFVTNGGTSVTKLEDVEELPTPLPTTTKANSIFVGWFYDSGFEVQAFSGDTISSNITLYAKWYTNMEDFYEDVADAIRSKTGETNPIKHVEFAYKIKSIPLPTYTLPQATETVLGGIKAKAKTTETNEVAIDTSTGKLCASSGGGNWIEDYTFNQSYFLLTDKDKWFYITGDRNITSISLPYTSSTTPNYNAQIKVRITNLTHEKISLYNEGFADISGYRFLSPNFDTNSNQIYLKPYGTVTLHVQMIHILEGMFPVTVWLAVGDVTDV